MTPTSFEELALAAPIKRALAELNYSTPSPIQAQSIPILLEGRDLLGIAQTGTGKTAAFSLPILDALHNNPQRPRRRSARVLVLTPTRELATQISQSFDSYGRHLRFKKTLVFGGVGKNPQIRAMQSGVDVLVACPGRLLDHMNEGDIELSGVEYFVLDEVDRMLDMGFLRDVKTLRIALPKKKQCNQQTSCNPRSARCLMNPASVSIAPEKTTAEKVDQAVCFVDKESKKDLLLNHLAEQQGKGLTIVFSRTKHGANKLCKSINSHGFEAEAIHGNRSQPQREDSQPFQRR